MYELTDFLDRVLKIRPRNASYKARATYHDSCSGLRELGVKKQPRSLLAGVEGLELTEMHEAEACCGFGGTFCVKYPDVSTNIADAKIENIAATGAECVIAGDLGCILNIEGRLHRLGKTTRVHHVSEVLAGMTEPKS